MKIPQHILVIRLSAMGDVAMTVPVLKALVQQYPTLKITVLSRAFLSPLFDDLPNVQFYVADVDGKHKGIKGLYQLAQEIKRLEVDAIADLHNVLRSQILRKFLALSHIKCAVIDKGRAAKKALIKPKNKVLKPLKSCHQRYAEVFKKLGFPVSIDQPVQRAKLDLNEKIQTLVGHDPSRWVGVAPYAQHLAKMYPEDLMRELVTGLAANSGVKVLLFGGGEKEKKQLLKLADSIDGEVISVVGALSFKEELVLISNLDVMLSMDSANGHLAANFGVPVITLWGGTHPYAGFAPFNQNKENQFIPDLTQYPQLPTSIYGNKLIKGYENAMRTIHPNDVIERIFKVLAQ
ncbi:glycosyltransferase family 9 protein [Flavobacteriaceae bacterium F08102]|nr:glycosyltransferase family 9 protein [Flavobacteriaceae bacterium F08102]